MLSRRALLQMFVLALCRPALGVGLMPYFSGKQHGDLIADPASILDLYDAERARFVTDLGSGFSAEIEDHFKLGFCGLVAFDLKPYAQSVDVTMEELLSADGLDCDNYVILTWRLFKLLCPQPTTSVAAVGWNGGSIGNHAQIFCMKDADENGDGGGYWMIDPTIGVMQCGYNFDGITRGIPAASAYRKDFYWRQGSITDLLHSNVINALDQGLYRPSNLLYYYTDLDKYVAPVPIDDWMTPQASKLSQ